MEEALSNGPHLTPDAFEELLWMSLGDETFQRVMHVLRREVFDEETLRSLPRHALFILAYKTDMERETSAQRAWRHYRHALRERYGVLLGTARSLTIPDWETGFPHALSEKRSAEHVRTIRKNQKILRKIVTEGVGMHEKADARAQKACARLLGREATSAPTLEPAAQQ